MEDVIKFIAILLIAAGATLGLHFLVDVTWFWSIIAGVSLGVFGVFGLFQE